MGVFSFAQTVPKDMRKENITSQIDGVKTVFLTAIAYESGSIRVYWNGIRQIKNVTFSELSSTQIQLDFTPQTGDYLTIDYRAK